MSAQFIVPIHYPFYYYAGGGPKYLPVILKNPRPAEEEEAVRPWVLAPSLGAKTNTMVLIKNSSSSTQWDSFNRLHCRQAEGNSGFWVSIRGPMGKVGLQIFSTSLSQEFLQPGSDYANGIGWFTYGSALTNLDHVVSDLYDFVAENRVIDHPGGITSFYFAVLTNDLTAEFNEDLFLRLYHVAGNAPVNVQAANATVTILFDDPPAGALDPVWNPAGVSFTTPPYNPQPGANNAVNSLAVQLDQRTIIVGDFTAYNSVPRNHIARINQDGALDLTFNPGTGANGPVNAIGIYPGSSVNSNLVGKIVIGGAFTSYNGNARGGIARLNQDGSIDPSFNPGSGVDGPIRTIIPLEDGKVLVGGDFVFVNGIERNRLARLNQDGSLDTTFNPGAGADAPVWALAVENGVSQKILVGGEFSSINGVPCKGIARLNSNGDLDPSFNAATGVDGVVYALALQGDGKILLGGAFSLAGSRLRNGVARFNVDGSLDDTFDPGLGFDGAVYALQVQPDGKTLLGGPFTRFDHVRRIGLARLLPNGALDTSFMDTAYNQFAGLINTFSFEEPNYINGIGLETNGNLMVGGWFAEVGGNSYDPPRTRADKQPRLNLARLIGGYTPGPGNIGFKFATNTVDENAGASSVSLCRTDGNLGTAIVNVTTSNRLAQADVDYTPAAGTVAWLEGAYPYLPIHEGDVGEKFFQVPILDNTLVDGSRGLDLLLRNPQGSLTLGGEFIPTGLAFTHSSSLLEITDNDVPPSVLMFSTADYLVAENGGTALITVLRTNSSIGTVWVDVSTSDGSAIAGGDYLATHATLIFRGGETSKTIAVVIVDDAVMESNKTVQLRLSHPGGGARLGSITNAALTIVDDDEGALAIRCAGSPNAAEFTLQFNGKADTRYQIEYSSNLVEWVVLATVTNSVGPISLRDVGATNQPNRFYRARLQ